MSFLYGIIFTITLLVVAVFARRFARKTKMKKYHSKGGNSRESVGENVVAILNNKEIKENWINRFERKLKGG